MRKKVNGIQWAFSFEKEKEIDDDGRNEEMEEKYSDPGIFLGVESGEGRDDKGR